MTLTYLSAFDTRAVMANGRKLQLYLISRRSRFRAGTRYFRRGIDHDGHVANFNETEQIATVASQADPNHAATTLSFVQIRGSVPVFWAEINTLRYKPDLQTMDLQDSVIIPLQNSFALD
jgi:phosphatidylinositol 4-phosphatase